MVLRHISRSMVFYKIVGERGTRGLTTDARQAFLQPLASHPGVTCLSLNRPQTKNAISLKLLQEFGECLDNVQFDKRYIAFIFGQDLGIYWNDSVLMCSS